MVFPVVSDADGALFRRLTNGWVPCNILVGRDGTVLFSENEFDEAGYTRAIAALYGAPAGAQPERGAEGAIPRRGLSKAASIVILGGGAGGIVAAHHLRRRLPKEHHVVVIDRSPDHLFASSLGVGARLLSRTPVGDRRSAGLVDGPRYTISP